MHFLKLFLLSGLSGLMTVPLGACSRRPAASGMGACAPAASQPAAVAQQPKDEADRVLAHWRAGTVVADSVVRRVGRERCFRICPIDDATFRRMRGRSYKEGCPVPRSDLRLLHVLHRNEQGQTQLGELVCHRDVASDLVSIFRQLYEAGYVVSRMVLVDDYGADDERSMTANNPPCFNFRAVAGTKVLSKHSMGRAVDLNPLRNPMVKRGADGRMRVSPKAGSAYADRSRRFAQRIDRSDLAYRLFTAHGFRWGGGWRSLKDYQHFEK